MIIHSILCYSPPFFFNSLESAYPGTLPAGPEECRHVFASWISKQEWRGQMPLGDVALLLFSREKRWDSDDMLPQNKITVFHSRSKSGILRGRICVVPRQKQSSSSFFNLGAGGAHGPDTPMCRTARLLTALRQESGQVVGAVARAPPAADCDFPLSVWSHRPLVPLQPRAFLTRRPQRHSSYRIKPDTLRILQEIIGRESGTLSGLQTGTPDGLFF